MLYQCNREVPIHRLCTGGGCVLFQPSSMLPQTGVCVVCASVSFAFSLSITHTHTHTHTQEEHKSVVEDTTKGMLQLSH